MRIRTHLRWMTLLALAATAARANDISTTGRFISTQNGGLPPLQVDSTVVVPNLNADLLDGVEAAVFSRKLANVVTVAKSGGDFTSIQAAIDSITGASATTPSMVYIAPGTYMEQVVAKAFVDLVGAGPGQTRIYTEGGDVLSSAFTLSVGASSEVRDLSILTAANASFSFAVGVALTSGSPVLRNVRVDTFGATAGNYGVVNSTGGLPEISDSIIVVSGTHPILVGIYNDASNLRLIRSHVTATGATLVGYGVSNASSDGLTLYDFSAAYSEISGDTADVRSDVDFVSHLRFSELSNTGYAANGGSEVCTFMTDTSGGSYPSTCP
jgi:hypothetical protein